MKVVGESNKKVFPMKVRCERIKDEYGFSYGREIDFCGKELEIEASDIRKHDWAKYPDIHGTDYGVVCPVCGKFIPIDRDRIPEYVLKDAEEIFFVN